jgi:hypothetical protein
MPIHQTRAALAMLTDAHHWEAAALLHEMHGEAKHATSARSRAASLRADAVKVTQGSREG